MGTKEELLEKWGGREFAEELRFLPAVKLIALFHHEYGGRLHLQKPGEGNRTASNAASCRNSACAR